MPKLFVKGTTMRWSVFEFTRIDQKKFQTDLYDEIEVIEALENAGLIRVTPGHDGLGCVTALQHITKEDVDAVLRRSGLYEKNEKLSCVIRFVLFGSVSSKRPGHHRKN